MNNNYDGSDLYDFFHELRAYISDCGADDIEIACSDDYKTLRISRIIGTRTQNFTFNNNETYWGYMYEYIRTVKLFMNEYNKYSDNGTADPNTKMWALRYAYNKRVHRCGDYW
jgi:hypothetical protein